MRAVVMQAFGDEGVLELADVATPDPVEGEALVRVGAVAVSRTRDVATRSGRHPFSRQVTLPHALGGDFAGVVERVGSAADEHLVGQRVAVGCSISCGECNACVDGRDAECASLGMIGIHRWGSYAEFASVPVSNLNPIPGDVGMAEAAAMAATGPIALTQLLAGNVGSGTSVLVTGATGALATAVITLADRLGATVIGTSRRLPQVPAALPLAAILDAMSETLTDELMTVTEGRGVEVVVDNVADPGVFTQYVPALALGGRIVVSGAIGGESLPILPVPAALLYIRSLSLLGVRTTSRAVAGAFWQLAADGLRFGAGLVQHQPFESVGAAHALIAGGNAVAHTVLVVDPDLR